MNTQTSNPSESSNPRRKSLLPGIVLILVGLFILVGQYLPESLLSNLFLPGLGLIFLAAGLITRQTGWLIPGGILSGIGLGAFLVEGSKGALSDTAEGGVFLLAFAGGFALITLLSFVTRDVHWWPLIPAGIMATIGGLLFTGDTGLAVLEMLGKVWPLGLILVGAYMIFKRPRLER